MTGGGGNTGQGKNEKESDGKKDSESAGKGTTRVGRWMSEAEYKKMNASNMVQESYSTTTHVANPADINAFAKQAAPGSIYVEFDVPTQSLKSTGTGWAKIVGPNSFEGRHYIELGMPKPEMPPATNIQIVGGK